MTEAPCPFCDHSAPERVAWSHPRCRVLLIEDSPFVGLCRVVWNAHVKELTDLGEADRAFVLRVVAAVEEGLRRLLAPDKMNLASFGNQVPHLHWHVIPRFADDSHYPEAIWAPAVRAQPDRTLPPDFAAALAAFLDERLRPVDRGSAIG